MTQLFFFHPPDFYSDITHLQNVLQQISSWMANLLTLNSKTEFLLIWLSKQLVTSSLKPKPTSFTNPSHYRPTLSPRTNLTDFWLFTILMQHIRFLVQYSRLAGFYKFLITLISHYHSFIKLDSMCWFSHQRSRGTAQLFTYLLWTVFHAHICSFTSAKWVSKMPHFGGVGPRVGPMNTKFELRWDFCTMHLATKFHHPMFNHSWVIMLTNKPRNKQTLLKTSTSLRYATPMGKNAIKPYQPILSPPCLTS